MKTKKRRKKDAIKGARLGGGSGTKVVQAGLERGDAANHGM